MRRSVLALRPALSSPLPQSTIQTPGISQTGMNGDDRGDGESKTTAPGLGLGLGPVHVPGEGVTLEDRLRRSLEELCGYRGKVGGDLDDANEENDDEEGNDDEEAVEEKEIDGGEDNCDGDDDVDMHEKEREQGEVLQGSALWKRLANRRQPKGSTTHPFNIPYTSK